MVLALRTSKSWKLTGIPVTLLFGCQGDVSLAVNSLWD